MADLTDGVPFLQAAHFGVGRDGREVDMLILHWMATSLAGADATFLGGGRVASATYGVEDARIHQYVRESDTSYNAADWDANCRSISIEHSAAPGRAATPLTVETSIQICIAMMRKYPKIGNRVYPHFKFTATTCPGTLPWEHIRDEALARLHSPQSVPKSPPPPAPPAPPLAVKIPQELVMLLDTYQIINIGTTDDPKTGLGRGSGQGLLRDDGRGEPLNTADNVRAISDLMVSTSPDGDHYISKAKWDLAQTYFRTVWGVAT